MEGWGAREECLERDGDRKGEREGRGEIDWEGEGGSQGEVGKGRKKRVEERGIRR